MFSKAWTQSISRKEHVPTQSSLEVILLSHYVKNTQLAKCIQFTIYAHWEQTSATQSTSIKKKKQKTLVNTEKKNTILATRSISGNTRHLLRTKPHKRHYSCDEHRTFVLIYLPFPPQVQLTTGPMETKRRQELKHHVMAQSPAGLRHHHMTLGKEPHLSLPIWTMSTMLPNYRAGARVKRCDVENVPGKMPGRKTDSSSPPPTRLPGSEHFNHSWRKLRWFHF